MDKGVDFFIIQKPVYIELECPHCKTDIRYDINNVDVPECWADDWGYIECPNCNKNIKLGEYEI